MFRGLYVKTEGLYHFTRGYFIPWPFPSVWQTHTEKVPGGSRWVLWEVKWVRVTLFCRLVSSGEITLKFVLLFLWKLFAMERGVYRVLLCSIVDIKGSIKLPLLIGKLEIEILKGKSKMIFSLPSKSLLHSLHEQMVFRETVSDLPNAESRFLPSVLTAKSQKLVCIL